jgi:hypothetical protein
MIGSCRLQRWAGGEIPGRWIVNLCLSDNASLIIAADYKNLAVLQQSRGMTAARGIQLAGPENLRLAERAKKQVR